MLWQYTIARVLTWASEQGEQGQRLLPQLLGRGSSAPRKFVDVKDWRWRLFTGGSHKHSFVSALYQINKTCRLLQLHRCCASFIIAYLKPAICDTNLLEHTVHSLYAHHAYIVLKFGCDRPNKGIRAPKILPKMAKIRVSGILRPNDSVASPVCCYVWMRTLAMLLVVNLCTRWARWKLGYRAPERTYQATELARNRITPLGGRHQRCLVI